MPYRRPAETVAVEVAAFAHFFELTPDAMVTVGSSGRIVVANRQVERVFGYDQAELVGEPVDKLVPERFRTSHGRHRASHFADPRNGMTGQGRLDLRGLRKDGSEFPAEITLASIETTDGLLATAAVRDVTERVEAERERAELEARRAREQATAQASRTESVGQLAGGVAHDFNNLLSVIMGNAEFLAEQLSSGTPGHDEIEEIQRASAQAARLTRQLLMFSQREIIEPEPLDLNAIVLEVECLLRRTLGEHVELVTRLATKLPPVRCDPGGIEQILVNLAINARDAMAGGGTLAIETAAVEIGAADVVRRPELAPGAHARISVSDTGHGMTPEVVARALEPFYSTKAKCDGTGLGLATVSGVVRQAGGGIELDSTVGAGTTVRVDLPLARGPTAG
jgi:PAS domain S-box-containing protein